MKLGLGTKDNPDHIAAEYIIAKVTIFSFGKTYFGLNDIPVFVEIKEYYLIS